MKIYIVHDSERGNGKLLSEQLESEFSRLGAEVVVGYREDITPEQVADAAPDLLIIGAAVRRFMMSPPVKRWIALLAQKLQAADKSIGKTAIFATHMMPPRAVEGRIGRLKQHITSSGSLGDIYADSFAGQVKAIPGPFVDGTMEKAVTFAKTVYAWAQN